VLKIEKKAETIRITNNDTLNGLFKVNLGAAEADEPSRRLSSFFANFMPFSWGDSISMNACIEAPVILCYACGVVLTLQRLLFRGIGVGIKTQTEGYCR